MKFVVRSSLRFGQAIQNNTLSIEISLEIYRSHCYKIESNYSSPSVRSLLIRVTRDRSSGRPTSPPPGIPYASSKYL